MAKEDYFAYPMPPSWKLREEFIVPYRFSDELKQEVKLMFEHPSYNKYRGVFTNLCRDSDLNDMLKSAYLCVRYFKAHPTQFANTMDNIAPWIIVRMWKVFLGMNKHLRGEVFTKYYPANMKMLVIGRGRFLDKLLKAMDNGSIILHHDEMVKDRGDDIGLRERKSVGRRMDEGGDLFEALCNLE